MGLVTGAIVAGVAAGVGAIAQADAAEKARRAKMSAAERAREDIEQGKKGRYKRTYTLSSGKKVSEEEFENIKKVPGGLAFTQDATFEDELIEKGYDQYMDDAELDLDTAYDKAMGLVDTGMGEMKTEYEGAIERFDPYAQQGKKALDLYMGMFSGGDGGAANIMNTPMFKAQQSEMNKQIAAQMAATGRGGSMKSIESTFAPAQQQLMRQAYGDYFRQLSPIVGYGYSATASQAGLQSDLGRRMMAGRAYQSGLEQQRGLGKSQLDQQRAAMGYQHSGNLANIELGKGAIEANYATQMGNIYSGVLDQAATFAGSMMGGGANIMGPSYGGQGYGQYGGYA